MRKKGLVFAEFPSPYRVKVMEELAKEYNLTVFLIVKMKKGIQTM